MRISIARLEAHGFQAEFSQEEGELVIWPAEYSERLHKQIKAVAAQAGLNEQNTDALFTHVHNMQIIQAICE